MSQNFKTFSMIMAFYILLSYIAFPVVFYYAFGNNLQMAGNGFILGSLISVLLWYFKGRYMLPPFSSTKMS